MFQDVHEEVQQIFEEGRLWAPTVAAEFQDGEYSGFHILCRGGVGANGARGNTSERRLFSKAYARMLRDTALAKRLLAGERPSGKHARRAARRVAATLGIALTPVKTGAERNRDWRRRQMRARLVAGDYPRRPRSPLWFEVAAEMGITLGRP